MSEEGDDLPWGELDINHLPVPGQHQPVGLRQLADIQCSLKAVYSFHLSYLSYMLQVWKRGFVKLRKRSVKEILTDV